jgi:hypothetical protein
MAPHALIGKVAAVRITGAGSNSLFGVLARDVQTGGTEAVAIASN